MGDAIHVFGTNPLPNKDITGGQKGKFPRNSPIPINLGNLSLLAPNEELVFHHDIASVMLDSREAEAYVVQKLLEEAKAAATLAASREAVATAEVKLAATHQKEARHRVNYFTRLYEVARQNVVDAKLQVDMFEEEQEKVGVKLRERNYGSQEAGRSVTVILD
ncbi:hypothetical protein C8F04DRAFT_1254279 [Mycena alexandri]|uniref:Uncharacterized protein n=1 Tax=Mycena alexandri TaxID=1745969 RepID=A0AAD6X827_9AGAR|nr:hypothetical protein C8F04DRAFT_1254279 [Mycena alexandri]